MLRKLVDDARRRILADPDSICLDRARLVTEAWQRHADEPLPLRRAHALAHILRGMTLDLDTNPVFAGNTTCRPRAWMILPEYSIAPAYHIRTENPELLHMLDGEAIPADLREFWKTRSRGGGPGGVGHLTVRCDLVVDLGLRHFVALAERDHPGATPEQVIQRKACAVACRAVIDWAGRFAEQAERMAVDCDDCDRAEALLRVAAACRHVPAQPARNLFEALQSILLIHCAIHIEGHTSSVSPGRIDKWLARFADDPREDLVEMMEAFLLKFSQVTWCGSHVMGQPITLGGTDVAGKDQCNRLTLAILEACRRIHMPDPYVFVRWHAGMDERVKRLSAEMLAEGASFPLLSGDAETRAGLENAGIDPADAAEYTLIGCNELGIPGKLLSMPAGSTEDIQSLRAVLIAADASQRIASMADLIDRMRQDVQPRFAAALRAASQSLVRSAQQVPTPLTSALMDGCIQRGRDMHDELRYHWLNIYVQGFSNVVNGLAAIDRVVFRDRAATIAQLGEALRTNFAGAEVLRQKLLEAPKWGNDDDAADAWASRWLAARDAAATAAAREVGCQPPLFCHVVRSMHISHGRPVGATPDGRLDGQMLSDSIGAPIGTPRHGPTAILNSVRKHPARRHWTGGYNLNIALPLNGDGSQTRALMAMADAFFASGGQELQVNALSAATLLDAQRHPDRHLDLVVRIAGYSAHFHKLTRQQQDELIARAQDAAHCD